MEFPQYQSYSAENVRQKGKPENGIVKKRVSDTDGIDKVFGGTVEISERGGIKNGGCRFDCLAGE